MYECVCRKERRFPLLDSFNRDWFKDAHDVELHACCNLHRMKSQEKFMDLNVFFLAVNAQGCCKSVKLVCEVSCEIKTDKLDKKSSLCAPKAELNFHIGSSEL